MLVIDTLAALILRRGAPEPLFRQLYAQIKEAILSGALAPGMQLPPTRELCTLLSVSRQTVLNAYEQLRAEGYLNGAVGKGTFIGAHLAIGAPQKPDAPRAAPRCLPLARKCVRCQSMPTAWTSIMRAATIPTRAWRWRLRRTSCRWASP